MMRYIHIGMYRSCLADAWKMTTEIYDDEAQAEADLEKIDNYQETIIVSAVGEPTREDWSGRIDDLQRARRLGARHERGLRSRPAGV